MNSQENERKVNLKKLTPEQAEELSIQLGEKIRLIFDNAIKDANYLLSPYGLEAKFQAHIGPIGKVLESLNKVKAKKIRKNKKTR